MAMEMAMETAMKMVMEMAKELETAMEMTDTAIDVAISAVTGIKQLQKTINQTSLTLYHQQLQGRGDGIKGHSHSRNGKTAEEIAWGRNRKFRC